ncbi:ribosomal L1 domain-containing protein 1 [Pholidichthys leucotaenia]
MAEKVELELDRSQVKKAVRALQAFLKTKDKGESLFLNETEPISLLFTLWKIPPKPQTIRIPLPHGQRTEEEEVCLFTRDEPHMTPEQTQRFYKKLLEERGVKNTLEVIPYKTLKTEYKPFEAKRRLLGNFSVFLSDDRIRRRLPSQLGKHFYQRKKEPLCVNLMSKNLARDIQRLIQGTSMKVTNKGCCCMARVAHSGMAADEVTDNIDAAVQTIVAKLRMTGRFIKVIHLKSQTSVALPIYTSDLSHLGTVLKEQPETPETPKTKKAAGKSDENKDQTEDKKQSDTEVEGKKKKKKKIEAHEDDEEEEIPQLVAIETPTKKPRLEKPSKKKQLKKAPKPLKVQKGTKAQNKLTKKTAKTDSKVKRKVLK